MGADAFIEPIVVASILTAGVFINKRPRRSWNEPFWVVPKNHSDGTRSPVTSESGLLGGGSMGIDPQWRERKFFGRVVKSRNTSRWRETKVSRFLARFPFLVEVWYWLLVYWTYQLGRAFTAVTLQADLTPIARLHGLSVIHLEQRLGIFIEPSIQHWFLARPTALKIINCIYSFIHIPGTIAFLAWLYHYAPQPLFEARRRTLAICNLMAFIVFTAWPCMPPRLLPKEDGFGFVDTVHVGKVSSVWTSNKFCQQLAAMPSLHFGYAFVIGLTIATMPNTSLLRSQNLRRRIILVTVGMAYPLTILVAIIATANHYVLDAVAGFLVAVAGWKLNWLLKNLLPLEDWVLNACHVHKPERESERDGSVSPGGEGKWGVEEEWWRRA